MRGVATPPGFLGATRGIGALLEELPGRKAIPGTANLSGREKDDIFDMPVVPEGIFGSAFASMPGVQRLRTIY